MLPNLEVYLQLLESEMQLEKQKNEMKRLEAWRVYGALMVSCLEWLMIFTSIILSNYFYVILNIAKCPF